MILICHQPLLSLILPYLITLTNKLKAPKAILYHFKAQYQHSLNDRFGSFQVFDKYLSNTPFAVVSATHRIPNQYKLYLFM